MGLTQSCESPEKDWAIPQIRDATAGLEVANCHLVEKVTWQEVASA